VIAHHNDCHDDCRHIADFMDRLNQLNAPLRWANLGKHFGGAFGSGKFAWRDGNRNVWQ
jgi:hypothetical protein